MRRSSAHCAAKLCDVENAGCEVRPLGFLSWFFHSWVQESRINSLGKSLTSDSLSVKAGLSCKI